MHVYRTPIYIYIYSVRCPLNHDLICRSLHRRRYRVTYTLIVLYYYCYIIIPDEERKKREKLQQQTDDRFQLPISDAIIINQRLYYASHAHEMKTNYLKPLQTRPPRGRRRCRTDVFNTAFIIYSRALGTLSYVKLILPLRRDYRVVSEKSC